VKFKKWRPSFLENRKERILLKNENFEFIEASDVLRAGLKL